MTLYTHAGSLPAHKYVWVEPGTMGRHGWVQAVWFGITCQPGYSFGCHVLLESGAIYRNVPLHQISAVRAAPPWTPQDAATWDAYGLQFSLIQYEFLRGMNARVRLQSGAEHEGQYLYTLVPVNDGFSAAPSQAKEFYFLELKNGRYTAQPTNHLLVDDRSFVTKLAWPKNLIRQRRFYTAEDRPAVPPQ